MLPSTCHSASHWNQMKRPHLASSAIVALASCPDTCHVDFKLACFIYLSLSGQAPPYMADDIHFSPDAGFGRSMTPAPLIHRQIVRCSTHTSHIWRRKLCCCWATCLEHVLCHVRQCPSASAAVVSVSVTVICFS